MVPVHDHELSTRERQIMDALYGLGRGTVSEVRARMPSPPSASAVRTMLGVLTAKGFLRRTYKGRAAVYHVATNRQRVSRRALQRVLDIFHGGSLAAALTMHLSDPRTRLTEAEVREIKRLLESKEGPT